MGRLTLNILLSFAQFEREVTASASATSSPPPEEGHVDGRHPALGYDVEDRKLVVEREPRPRCALDLRALPRDRLGTELAREVARAAASARRAATHRQEVPLPDAEQPRLHRRGGAQGHGYPGEHERHHRPRDWDKVHAILQESPRKRAPTHPRRDARAAEGAALRPDGAAFSPTHTRKGRLYRYYVSQTVLKHGAGSCPVGRVPAARSRPPSSTSSARRVPPAGDRRGHMEGGAGADDDITEADAREALQQLDPLWDELFPAEQARIVALLVERVDIGTDGLNVRLPGPTTRWSRRWRAPSAGSGCWSRASSPPSPNWPSARGSRRPT
jgi:site-specific DNA recombinase